MTFREYIYQEAAKKQNPRFTTLKIAIDGAEVLNTTFDNSRWSENAMLRSFFACYPDIWNYSITQIDEINNTLKIWTIKDKPYEH